MDENKTIRRRRDGDQDQEEDRVPSLLESIRLETRPIYPLEIVLRRREAEIILP